MYSLNEIINKVDAGVYHKGSVYYDKGKVQNVHTYKNRTKFFVKGQKMYHIEIEMASIKEKDKAKSIFCSCDKFASGEICKHIIATIIYLKNNDLERIKEIEDKEELIYDKVKPITVLNYLERLNSKNEIRKERIIIEYTLDLSKGIEISISFGKDDKIKVSDLSKKLSFFNGNDQKLRLNSNFVFDKTKHYIKEGDLRNIKILDILPSLEVNTGIDKRNIPPELLIKILNQMDTNFINIKIDNKLYKDIKCIFSEDLKLNLGMKDDKFTFSCDLMKNVKSYRYGNLYIKFNEKYIAFFENEEELLTIFPDGGKGEVNIDKVDFQNFIDTVYDKKYRKYIEIDESLKDILEKKKYTSEIFLLKNKNEIISKIKIVEKESKAEFTIRDDKEKEAIKENIEKRLRKSGFSNINGRLRLIDEKKIFKFFKYGINELENNEEVLIYYTQNLKKYYNKCNNISVNISENTINLLDLEVQINDFTPKEIFEILKGIEEKRKYIRLNGEQFIDLESDSIDELEKILNEIGNISIKDNKIKLNKFKGIELFGRIDKNKLDFIDENNIADTMNEVLNFKNEEIKIDILDSILRDYQKDGVKWLKALKKCNLAGILADEMGLGKTIQVISLLGNIKNKSLIIVPSSLMYNWKKEFEKFTPNTKVAIVSGSIKERKKIMENKDDYDIIITSYPLIRRDLKFYIDDEFEYCILDEGQYIKNSETKTSKSVKKIKSRHRLILTGTPLENNLMELWSMFDFILPGYLNSKSKFKKEFIKNSNNHEKLVRLTSPFILRRKKNEVLNELPEKIINVVYSKLNKKQMRIYDKYILEMKYRLKELSNSDEINQSKIEILSILTRLRQICCDPGLFLKKYNEKSGKLQLLEELIEELLEGGHKILIFSQFTSMLEKIATQLRSNKIEYSYLDGQVRVNKREKVINDFTSGKKDIFLISLKAGGTGLNLTRADTVIHVDPWWNPAVEDQATDRAHRIGQKDVVNVYKILTRNTIEEKIYEIQTKKRKLIDNIIEKSNGSKEFNKDEIYEVLQELV